MTTDLYGGKSPGSDGGGSGGGGDAPEFETVYEPNLAALDDENFAANGPHDIAGDGVLWTLNNISQLTSADVGGSYGGLRLQFPASAVRNYFSGRNAGHWTLPLAQLLGSSPQTEVRLTWRWSLIGGFTGNFNNVYSGIQSLVANANYYHWFYQGLPSRDLYLSLPITNLVGADLNALGFYPNVIELTFFEGLLRKVRYSNAVAASIEAATMVDWRWGYSTNPIHIPPLQGSSAIEFFFAFNADNTSSTATELILNEIKVEKRPSPLGGLVFLT